MGFPFLAVSALMGSLVSLSLGTSFAKSLFPMVGAAGTTTFRLVFATAILMLLWRPWRQRWQRSDWPALAAYGLTLGTMNLLFYNAIKFIPFGLAIAIEFSGPLAVAIWNSRRWMDAVWVILAISGLALLLPLPGLDSTALDWRGVAFALAAGVCWGLYIVFGQRVSKRFGDMATPMGMLFAALAVTPFGMAQAGAALLDSSLLAAGLGVAVLSSAIPYSLEMYALRHLPKQTFSILLSLEPATGAVAGWLVLGEQLSALQVLAMGLVMVASMGSAWGNTRTPALHDAP